MSKDQFQEMRVQELAAETMPFVVKDNNPHHSIQDNLIDISNKVENGELSVLDGLIQMKKNQDELEKSIEIIKAFKDDNFETIDAESKEYQGEYGGFEIGIRNGGKMFNYKGVSEWVETEAKKKVIEQKYKLMWEAKQKGLPYANVDEDGVALALPEVSYRRSSIIIKAKK